MGIDYGAKRVGVAVSDDMHQYAFPRGVLTNDERLLDHLHGIVADQGVERIVVGEADNPIGGQNTIARRIAIFSEAMAVRTELPVEMVSEVYTSAEARRALEEKVAKRKDKSVPVDAAAAAIILQKHLDTSRANKNAAQP